jgi:hypothetical protein
MPDSVKPSFHLPIGHQVAFKHKLEGYLNPVLCFPISLYRYNKTWFLSFQDMLSDTTLKLALTEIIHLLPKDGETPNFPLSSLQNTLITFDYKNWRGDISRRTALPICLKYGPSQYHLGNNWLLVCHDPTRGNNLREFALDDFLSDPVGSL